MTLKSHSQAITVLRATASFWVLCAHCMIWGGWYGIPLPSPKHAVSLFMMISGFLMVVNTDTRQEELTSLRRCMKFWARRYFRLAPAYYLSLLVAVASAPFFLEGYATLQGLNPQAWEHERVYLPSQIQYTWQNVLLHVTFLFGLLPEWSASTMLPDWSLGLEMQFYAAFPLLLLVLNRWKLVGIVCLAIVTTQLARHVHGFREQSLLILQLNYFLAGMLLARPGVSWRHYALAIALAAVGHSLVPPVLVVLMALLRQVEIRQGLPAWLTGRVVTFASDTSYAVYLFHGFFISACGLLISSIPVLHALQPPLRVSVMFCFVTTATYATGWMVYRFVEQPGIAWGRRWMAARSSNPLSGVKTGTSNHR